MQKRIYISGPMTGLPDFNYPAFHAAAQALREAGYTVFNPAENGLPPDGEWADHLRTDIKALMDCTEVATLPGWMGSDGATLEVHIARRLKMRVLSVETWIAMADEGVSA